MKAAVIGRPYEIKFGGPVSMQFVDDTAKIFISCAESQKTGSRVYNIRGSVVTVEEVISSIEQAYPRARGLIRCTSNRLGIAANLSEEGLKGEIGKVPSTALREGIEETIAVFEQLKQQSRLDISDLEV
jgi:nucleoside-diphosphate-sugar epimerase